MILLLDVLAKNVQELHDWRVMNKKPLRLTSGQFRAYAILAAIGTIITAGLITIELTGSAESSSIALLAIPLWCFYIVARSARAALNWIPEQRSLLLFMALILTCAFLVYAFIAVVGASAPALAWALVVVFAAMTTYCVARLVQAVQDTRQNQGPV